jgi:hypothetical protein
MIVGKLHFNPIILTSISPQRNFPTTHFTFSTVHLIIFFKEKILNEFCFIKTKKSSYLTHKTMKKIFITFILLFPLWAVPLWGGCFAQSITIIPTNILDLLEIKKSGIGLDHRDLSNVAGVGTSIISGQAYFQTHTNHPLNFSTNNGAVQMRLSTNGNFSIGTSAVTTQKLFVQGNTYFTGNLDSDGQISVGSLVIGGGSTINKFFKVYLPEVTTPALTAKTCSTKSYAVSGVSSTDIVTISVVGSLPGGIAIANVLPSTNAVEVKFCNSGTTNISVQTVDLKFNIIK